MRWMKRAALALVLAMPVAGLAADTPASAAKDELAGEEVEALFSPAADTAAHASALKHAVRLAMAGDGRAAFYLGVVYRHGEEHPSQAVERNVETGRYWLEKCVGSERCPAMALASLAELELKAGNDKAAMQWAQAWATMEQQIEKKRETPSQAPGRDAYAAHLLSRCFERLPRSTRDDLASQWFKELLDQRGKQLDRMLDGELKGSENEKERWTSFFVRKSRTVRITRPPDVPSMALFLLRAAPAGGRAENVTLIEGVPNPNKLGDFGGLLGRFESKPYPPSESGAKHYAFLPIMLSDPRYGLTPIKD